MYNFTDPSLLPDISCNAICSEGYEVTNLTSSNAQERRRGFMVYNAVKPPVEITLQLICKINLSHICIWPTVGNQKSCGFEIEIKDGYGKGVDGFVTTGKRSFGEEPGIVFFRRDCRDNELSVPAQFVKQPFINKQNALSNSDCLKIKIYKTYNSSLAALGRIEVWGTVSGSCSQSTKETVRKLYSKRTERKITEISRSSVNLCKLQGEKLHAVPADASGLIIPDDFKDAITLDIMSVPMILPSGKVVDQSTLEKHEMHEARWGRPPSDPFTGKLFSNNSHPVLAPALKARIDKFLIDNAHCQELFTVARTSGRRETHSLSQSACAVTNKDTVAVSAVNTAAVYLPTSSDDATFKVCSEKSDSSKHNKTDRTTNNRSITVCSENFLKTQKNNEEAQKKGEGKGSVSFDEILESKLNVAVKLALANRPSFVNCDKPAKHTKTACSDCDGNQLLYVLSCKHLFCRHCLFKKAAQKTMICSVCKFRYTHTDPSRYHVT
ncbi:RING finger protein 37-like [Schistocerca gregaria]|uniref:RING finger protein 37-like n=1 Tax=Schistocerca gregaria TaxID=7010 RepID=UPI00211E50DD|nr:RING finger protein 37-like [Schistocerca gregaria]